MDAYHPEYNLQIRLSFIVLRNGSGSPVSWGVAEDNVNKSVMGTGQMLLGQKCLTLTIINDDNWNNIFQYVNFTSISDISSIRFIIAYSFKWLRMYFFSSLMNNLSL